MIGCYVRSRTRQDSAHASSARPFFAVEDEIMLKRAQLIDQLEQRLAQRTTTETLFTIRWAVV